jgi:hypothetical protein
MKLEELKQVYRNLNQEEFRRSLNLDLAVMDLTGELESGYAIKINVAQETGILSKDEINNYKIKGFEALAKNW